MKAPLLTIAIPTFNRAQQLNTVLKAIAPQLTKECELMIIDNSSDYDVKTLASEILSKLDNAKWCHIRNTCNIGANANFLRCMELAKGDWLWILGDDDPPKENAVQQILADINNNTSASIISYDSHYGKAQSGNALGITDFIQRLNFGNSLFISTTIYRTKQLLPNLNDGYDMISSYAPHIAVSIGMMCEENAQATFKSESLVNSLPAELSHKWNRVKINSRLFLLTEHLKLSSKTRNLLSRRIAETICTPKCYAIEIISICIASVNKTHSIDDCIMHWSARFNRSHHLRYNISFIAWNLAGRICFTFPKAALLLAKSLLWLTQKKTDLSVYAMPPWNNRKT